MSPKVQHRCDDCGFVTALSTPAVADYSLRRHSCATQRERVAQFWLHRWVDDEYQTAEASVRDMTSTNQNNQQAPR